ncbi:hypothetical protein [Capnocytophaga gingivalis]|uniref:hypothetical protein n=1 Tax=Capnocytophaga gingivalis TaxID=1017 RepID=UPI00235300D5|nr:hypothetical protein [Capnocytophaga gingivalis]
MFLQTPTYFCTITEEFKGIFLFIKSSYSINIGKQFRDRLCHNHLNKLSKIITIILIY